VLLRTWISILKCSNVFKASLSAFASAIYNPNPSSALAYNRTTDRQWVTELGDCGCVTCLGVVTLTERLLTAWDWRCWFRCFYLFYWWLMELMWNPCPVVEVENTVRLLYWLRQEYKFNEPNMNYVNDGIIIVVEAWRIKRLRARIGTVKSVGLKMWEC